MVAKYSLQKRKIKIYALALLLSLFAPAGNCLGAIALEETVNVAVPQCNSSTCPQETLTLPEWTPQANELILVSVALRSPTRKVSVSGNNLTFVEIANVDNVQNQSGIHIFRSMGSSPTTGSITVSFYDLENHLIQTYAAVSASRFSGVNTSGTNGSGAIEATATDPGPASDNSDMKVDITTLSDNAWTFAAGTYRTRTFEDAQLPSGQTLIVQDLLGGAGGDKVPLSTWYKQVATGGTSLTMGEDSDISGNTDWAIAAVSIKADDSVAVPGSDSLSVTPTELNLFVGGNDTFTISGGTPDYTVDSEDTYIANLHHDGTTVTVTGTGSGITTIDVTDADGNIIKVDVYVSDAFIASPSALNMVVNDQSTVTISGGVAGYSVSSTDDTVVETTPVDSTTIKVKALKAGAVAINISDSVGSTIQVPVFVSTNADPGLTGCPIPPFTTSGTGPNVMLIIDNSGSMSDGTNTQCTPTDDCSKWEKALTAARLIVQANPHIRFGLARMDRSGGGKTAKSAKIMIPCGYKGPFSSSAAYIDWYIQQWAPLKDETESQTNLAQTLASVGQYFATKLVCDEFGENCQRRGMRVGDSADNSDPNDFGYYKQDNNYTYTIDGTSYDAATTDDLGNTIDTTSPIRYSCEKSFIIYLTDGLSFGDKGWDVVDTVIGDYDNDGEEAKDCWRVPTPPNPTGNDGEAELCVKEQEDDGSTYMDDVAQFLYESDLRSDIDGIQNVQTYVIGFDILNPANQVLVRHAAEQGGGFFIAARDDLTQLTDAFNEVIGDINAKISSGTAVAPISTSASDSDYFIRARFFPGPQSFYGYLESFELPFNENDAYWKAHEMLTHRINTATHSDRKIYTYMGDQTLKKQSFEKDNVELKNRLQASLYWDLASTTETENIINYIRGDNSYEGNPYRPRDNWYLGDIIYSSPATVGPPKLYYSGNKLPEYTTYQIFKSNKADRETMVYVGANDGMLHAFKAFNDENAQCGDGEADYASDKCGGFENWAFIPEQIQPSLKKLTVAGCHQYYVDLTPVSADVWMGTKTDIPDAANPKWRSVLIGGNRFGGNEYFCLDITDPSPSVFDILWDVRPFTVGDFKSSTLPAIGKIRAGDESDSNYVETWAALVASGYHEGLLPGRVRALNIADGSPLKIWGGTLEELPTQIKSGGTYYTLTSPIAFDSDNDGYLDLMYVGDSNGIMWKFYYDYQDKYWKNVSLFTAGSGRAITTEPSIIFDTDGNLRIYFGTGRYLTDGDKSDTTRNAFYCLIEKPFQDSFDPTNPNNGHFTRDVEITDLKDLTTTLTQATFEAMDPGDITKVYENGWFFQLEPAVTYPSERVLARPIVLAGVVFCTTYMPDDDVCGYGGQSRLYAINYLNGLPGSTNGEDVLAARESGTRYQVVGSGIPSKPVYYFDPADKVSKLFIQKSDSSVVDPVINIGQRPMRMTSWRD